MKKLEKFLDKFQKVESHSTYSKYYQIESCKIRLSDHFSTKSDFDLQIIIPLNGGNKYIVASSENTTTYLWGTNTIIDFIKQLVLFCNLKAKSVKQPDSIKINKIQSRLVTASGLSKDVGNVLRHAKNDFWKVEDLANLAYLIGQELNIPVPTFSETFKDFLLTTPCGYVQVLNLFKTVYIDNAIIEDKQVFIKILNS